MEKAEITVDESTTAMVKLVRFSLTNLLSRYVHIEEPILIRSFQIDEATREATSGQFKLYDGSTIAW
jgi:hypothetical protein